MLRLPISAFDYLPVQCSFGVESNRVESRSLGISLISVMAIAKSIDLAFSVGIMFWLFALWVFLWVEEMMSWLWGCLIFYWFIMIYYAVYCDYFYAVYGNRLDLGFLRI